MGEQENVDRYLQGSLSAFEGLQLADSVELPLTEPLARHFGARIHQDSVHLIPLEGRSCAVLLEPNFEVGNEHLLLHNTETYERWRQQRKKQNQPEGDRDSRVEILQIDQ